MDMPCYTCTANEVLLDFEFESVGPNGCIKKMIRYSPVIIDKTIYFNLAFGDWDDQTKEINDQVISNNGDTEKILATVAKTVVSFLAYHRNAIIIAQGSTIARTRLYQMAISRNWSNISLYVHILGSIDNRWEKFRKGVNYEAFLVTLKNDNFTK